MLAVGGQLLAPLEERCVCMATGFGGGVGGTREELCGAFSAGVMVIGGLYGRSTPGEDNSPAYDYTKEFRRRFAERWGSLTCAPIRDWAQGPSGPGGCRYVVEETAGILVDVCLSPRQEAEGG